MLKYVALLALLAVTSFAAEFKSIGYKTCASESTIVDVKSDLCELVEKNGRKVCLFQQGTSPNIRITFEPKKNFKSLKSYIRAKIGQGAMVEFPQSDTNACNRGPKCPLKAGEKQTYEQEIHIASHYPVGEQVQVNWQLVTDDADAEKVVCFIFIAEMKK
ncbi:unnamed protein product [Caenorhabditis auriculariae]|uniref:MD-2-related lipid-recognition domain-containing protein n=1 Tax=Caenorhabditis auriculariae TaxID=2777116 RepID=A0A8S1HJ99_9PELO|nr:unnamed protein product [Caenorhabditis auriculariae]